MNNVSIEKKNGETIGLQPIAIHDIGVDYIRFTNGVQICWGTKTFNSDEINLNQDVSKAIITFPVAFYGGPNIILGRQCGYRDSANNDDAGLYAGYIESDHFVVCGSTKMDRSEVAVCMYAAFGRWK